MFSSRAVACLESAYRGTRWVQNGIHYAICFALTSQQSQGLSLKNSAQLDMHFSALPCVLSGRLMVASAPRGGGGSPLKCQTGTEVIFHEY